MADQILVLDKGQLVEQGSPAALRAKPGHGRTVEQALRACVEGSRAEPGCRFYDLHVDRSSCGDLMWLSQS